MRVSVPPATPRTPRVRRRPCARPGPPGDTTEVEELDLARLTPEATPAALAEWQRAHEPGAELDVHGRWFGPVPFAAVALGAGTSVVSETEGLGLARWRLRREATLADLVAPKLAVLSSAPNPAWSRPSRAARSR